MSLCNAINLEWLTVLLELALFGCPFTLLVFCFSRSFILLSFRFICFFINGSSLPRAFRFSVNQKLCRFTKHNGVNNARTGTKCFFGFCAGQTPFHNEWLFHSVSTQPHCLFVPFLFSPMAFDSRCRWLWNNGAVQEHLKLVPYHGSEAWRVRHSCKFKQFKGPQTQHCCHQLSTVLRRDSYLVKRLFCAAIFHVTPPDFPQHFSNWNHLHHQCHLNTSSFSWLKTGNFFDLKRKKQVSVHLFFFTAPRDRCFTSPAIASQNGISKGNVTSPWCATTPPPTSARRRQQRNTWPV